MNSGRRKNFPIVLCQKPYRSEHSKSAEMDDIKTLMDRKDFSGLRQILSANPALANEGLPYDGTNTTKAHPLHRICDAVFLKKYSGEESIKLATIFLEHGADINGGELVKKKDSPLIAACSLNADELAIFYIEHGADIHHAGTHGGTALHWAAWCGRDHLVKRLIEEGADINKICIDFKATPLFWAVHGSKNVKQGEKAGHLQSARILIDAGADVSIPNAEGNTPLDLISENDQSWKIVLTGRRSVKDL